MESVTLKLILFSCFLCAFSFLLQSQIIGGGGFHSTVRCGNGNVSVFGWDGTGQLAQGAPGPNLLTPGLAIGPAGVGFLDQVTRTLGGELHSIALRNDGTVWTWGSNSNGQIGNTGVGVGTNVAVPTQVQGVGGVGILNSVASIGAGYYYSMALLNDGTVYAWGDNSNGQLGIGNTIDQATPVQVTAVGFDSIVQIECGELHTLALDSAGNVWVWGYDWEGRLGLGPVFGMNYTSPVQLTALSSIVEVSAGRAHSVFLDNAGTVYSCGSNFVGATGTVNAPLPGGWVTSPTRVLDLAGGPGYLTNIVEIDAGSDFSLARTAAQNVVAWGTNFAGHLGDNTQIDRAYPVSVLDPTGGPGLLSNITEIGVGNDHCMALDNTGAVYSWGHNSAGPLGIGSSNFANPLPVLINGLCFVSPLPIELTEFSAFWNEGKVELNWVTASEINNNYFTVEKSLDGKNWEKVLTIDGAGNSHQIINYFEIDYNPYNDLSYYRLKQTDFNGEYSYSNIISVKPINNPLKFNLYPNPNNGKFNINMVNNDESFLLVLKDAQGREIYSKVINSYINGKDVVIDLETKISSGNYTVTGTSRNKYFQSKLIVK